MGRPLALASAPLASGALLADRYEVLRLLHEGGMSTVYLVNDRKVTATRALKELRLGALSTEEEAREAEAWFARESYVLSTLRHPLIPAFYSVFREHGHAYIVQEYIEGENLADLVRREGPQPEAQVVAWGMALADLLHFLHTQPDGPIIFRDVKPANILWNATGQRLAMVDFGIARALQPGEVGTVIGTPGYAPPEQYQGLADPRSDVYALGATLHHLLTAYDPEHGTPFTFPLVRDLNPACSPDLAVVITRALLLNPGDRYPSALAMQEELAACLPATRPQPRPTRPQPPGQAGLWPQVYPPLATHPRMASLGTAALIALLVLLISLVHATQVRPLMAAGPAAFNNLDGLYLPAPLVLGHFTHSGNLDLAVAQGGSLAPLVFLGTGNGRFRPVPQGISIATLQTVSGLAAGDFSHHGRLDMVVVQDADTLRTLLNNGNGSFRPGPRTVLRRRLADPSSLALAVGDFNADGNLDLAAANPSTGTVEVLLGNGHGGFTEAPGSPLPWATTRRQSPRKILIMRAARTWRRQSPRQILIMMASWTWR
jgi:tRNA A-37 threonylcarbamoyl transferase component Bud32